MKKVETALENIANLGESPFWNYEQGVLYFVDIDGKKINRYNPKTGENTQTETPGRIGMAALCSEKNKLVCAIENSIYFYNLEDNIFMPYIENIFAGSTAMRFNDGKCDGEGRLYVGSLDFSGEKKSELYMIDNIDNNAEAAKIKVCDGNISISNGIAFSNDGKYMYYIDTPTGFLWRYDYDKYTGNIENKTTLIDYREEKGNFDGMTIDSQGALWIASWGGFSITKYDPVNGVKLEVIDLPAPNVTSCEFGGDNMTTLFITTAGGADNKLRAEYPLSGSLFAVETDVKGMKHNKFAI